MSEYNFPKHTIHLGRGASFRRLKSEEKKAIEQELKAMLHAHRDCLRNLGVSLKHPFDIKDGYYGEAFGMLRALSVLGYGFFGAVNVGYEQGDLDHNLNYWLSRLEKEVLDEENWYGDHRCEFCFNKYGKDDRSLLDQGKIFSDETS